MILRGAQQQNQVTIQAFQHRETDRASQQKPNITHKNRDIVPAPRNLLRDLPEWFQEFTENLEDEGVLASRDTPANISQDIVQKWYRGRTVSVFTSRRQKLRDLHENQDYEDSLQEAHWRSSTSSR